MGGAPRDAPERVEVDPAANPIELLAGELRAELQSGAIDRQTLGQLVQRLIARAFAARARRIHDYLGETDPERNRARLVAMIEQLVRDPAGELLSVAQLQARLGRRLYGLVLTAHPTFSLALPLQRDLIRLAIGRAEDGEALDEAARAELLERVERANHRPEQGLDLDAEHAQSVEVIHNLRKALRTVYGAVFDVVHANYPDDWQAVTPCLVSLASWVGYDTDGRSDISWATTYAKRVRLQIDQFEHVVRQIGALQQVSGSSGAIGAVLELIAARLALADKELRDELRVFEGFDAKDPAALERLAEMAREMHRMGASRLTDARQLVALLDRALLAADEPATRRELWVLRAEIATQGLSAARTHVRINAVQLHNAIRKSIGMDHAADDPVFRLSYRNAVVEMIDAAVPETVNFGSVAAEKTTARRVFMLIAQMLKNLDSSEPIRFLIAECETPFTLLTALYFAKRFGVDRHIDISPLFETIKALDRGIEVLEGALEVPAYRDYLRGRGRMCIQTGFSDAGRYLGQIAASFAIERLRLGLADLLTRHGLADIELVVFDTHGESIGRGAHPDSLRDRFLYYDTPECRRQLEAAGIRLTEESSFQGGDGYLFFLHEHGALAVLTRMLEHCLEPAGEGPDPFYAETAYTDEFFAAIRQFNARIIDDPCYATLLGSFGTNMLYPTGSRSLKRQHDRGGAAPALEHPSQLRAIPHNAILQQLGILANTIGGVGQAVDKDPQAFQRLYRESARFRRLMTMVEHAFKFTDPDVLVGYLDLFSPGDWLRLAQLENDPVREETLRQVSGVVERMALHDRLGRVSRTLIRDYIDLARALREHRRLTRDAGAEPIVVDLETRNNLNSLHALRIAVIQALMQAAVHVPDFSDRHNTTHDEVIVRLMRLEVEPALELLTEVFPLTDEPRRLDFGEPASYRDAESHSYAQEHELIFRPIAAYYDVIRRIGSGVLHHIGAIG
ncbi:MAG: phosphoenolpyruvate carboxylase [Geminicoccaceae bacterium]